MPELRPVQPANCAVASAKLGHVRGRSTKVATWNPGRLRRRLRAPTPVSAPDRAGALRQILPVWIWVSTSAYLAVVRAARTCAIGYVRAPDVHRPQRRTHPLTRAFLRT